MIRIDEIYNNTFWPWFKQNRPGTRVFFCDPFGHTDPEHLYNFGSKDILETDYVYLHDQEPIHLDLHSLLFDNILQRTGDIGKRCKGSFWVEEFKKPAGHIIVSERGEYADKLKELYGWNTHYYFFHGWACQDWFRGYDKTFLIARARDRAPTKTFMSPNRIVAGKRDHRVLFLYNVFKHHIDNNHISAPRVCTYENIDISEVAIKYNNIYPDIEQVFKSAELPRLFSGEETQEMSSCWLTNFTESADSLFYVPTETVFFGRRLHITEKTFKAIALEMPFILIAPSGSLEYMRSYGFKTFSNVINEDYDLETDDFRRIELVTKLLKDINELSVKERQRIHLACLPAVEHNFNHFYNGGFTDVLWKELQNMLAKFKQQ